MKSTFSLLLLPILTYATSPNWDNSAIPTHYYYENNLPAVYYPHGYHWMTALSAFGDSFEIEDGSVWKINDYWDGSKIFDWRKNDPLLLTQNRDWFSTYQYRIINQTTGTSVGANLSQGPFLQSEHSRFISAIYEREVILTDGSRWAISWRDLSLFEKWLLNDCIIVGTNSGWDSSYGYILINTNMNHCVRAKFYQGE